MAFKQVGGKVEYKYIKYSESQKGDILAEGTYLGTRLDQYGKPSHMIRQKDSTVMVLNSSGQLDWTMENNVTVGDYVRVTFDGVAKLKDEKFKKFRKKGEDFVRSNQFVVEVDDERRSAVKTELEQEVEELDSEEEMEDEVEQESYKPSRLGSSKKAPVVAEEDDADEETSEDDEEPETQSVLNKYRRKA